MESTGADGSPSLDEVSTRARRRLFLLMGAASLAGAVGSQLLTPVLFGTPSHRERHHHNGASIALNLAIAVVVIAVGVAVLVWIVRKLRRNEGMFTAPLIGGLRRKQRRTAARAIRHGTPSSDPTLAAVERHTAERIVKYSRRSLAVIVVTTVFLSIMAVVTKTVIGHIFFATAAANGLVIIGMQVRNVRGARRYVATPADERFAPLASRSHTSGWLTSPGWVETQRKHPVLLAQMRGRVLVSATVAEVAFFVVAFVGGAGVKSISYPAPLKVIEVVSILAIVLGVPLLLVRSRYMPLVALAGTLGGVAVARHDETVPGQRGTFELVALSIFAVAWLALSVTALVAPSQRA